jgi:hypothetical protein
VGATNRAEFVDARGNVRERLARERDAPAGFAPDVLATFERELELIDIVALHLLDRHFAPGLHEELLEAVSIELGAPFAGGRHDTTFRARALAQTAPSTFAEALLRRARLSNAQRWQPARLGA